MKVSLTALLAVAATQISRSVALPSTSCDGPVDASPPSAGKPGGPHGPGVTLQPISDATKPVHPTNTPPQPGKPSHGPGGKPGHTQPGKPGDRPPIGGPKPPVKPPTTTPTDNECDVAILGGGAAGSYAAVQLVQQNISVCIVEKRDKLGGAVNTYTDAETGATVDYGVIHWTMTPEMVAFFNVLGVELKKSDYQYNRPQQIEFDFEKGVALNITRDIPTAIGNYIPTLMKYGEEMAYSWPGEGVAQFEADGLLEPMPAYMQSHGMEDLSVIVRVSGMLAQPLGEHAAAYLFKVLDFVEADDAVPVETTVGFNNSLVYDRVAKMVGEEAVFFNSEATSINRNVVPQFSNSTASNSTGASAGHKVEVVVKNSINGAETTIKAKALLTAFLPNTASASAAFDFNAAEKGLFSKFETSAIHSGLVKYTNLPRNLTLTNTAIDKPLGEPDLPYVLTMLPDEPLGVGLDDTEHFYIAAEAPLSDDEVYDLLVKSVNNIVSNLSPNSSFPAVVPEIVALDVYPAVSPRVSAAQIKGGFYSRLEALQGANNAWWAGNYIGGWKVPAIARHLEMKVLPGLVESLKA